MTAIMRRSSVGPIEIDVGSIWPFHQMLRIPAHPATKPAMTKARVRCRGTLKPSDAILIGSSRVPCKARPKGVRAIALKPR